MSANADPVTASGSAQSSQIVLRSAFWRLVEAIGGEGLAFVVFVIMARMLLPESFGLVALAAAVVSGVQVILYLGFAEAVIQGRHADDRRLSTAFWWSLSAGLIVAAVLVALALPLALLFDKQGLAPILATLAIMLPISGAATVFQAKLVRRMAFRAVALRSLAATGVGGAVGLIAALSGAEAYALVAQQLCGTIAALVVLLIAEPWRPRLVVDADESRSLIRFALPVMGTHLAKYVGKKADIAVLGLFASTALVGSYFLATRLIFALGIATHYMVSSLVLPVLSRIADKPNALRPAAARALWLTVAYCLPASLGLALIAEALVPWAFGDNWSMSVLPLQILASLAIFYALGLISGQILVAAGHPERFLRLAVGNSLLFIAMVSVAAPHGLAAVALAGGLANAFLLPAYLLELRRTVGLDLGAVLRCQLPLYVAAAAMAAGVIVISTWSAGRVPPLALLFFEVLGGAAVYGLALWLLAADSLRALLASLKESPGSHDPNGCAGTMAMASSASLASASSMMRPGNAKGGEAVGDVLAGHHPVSSGGS